MSFETEGIDHVALAVRDVAMSVKWYQEVLGLKRLHEQAWGDHPAVVGVGNTAIALFQVDGDSPNPPPGRDTLAMRHLAFRVNSSNFDKARVALSERGIPFEFQDHDISLSIYFTDPDGHRIEITTYDLDGNPRIP